ncbi:MAG: hypothetical protein ABIP13_10870 [Tepidiformaceae bacterium]
MAKILKHQRGRRPSAEPRTSRTNAGRAAPPHVVGAPHDISQRVLEVQRTFGNRATSEAIRRGQFASPSTAGIQRLWSSKQFKESSTAAEEDEAKRVKILPVEAALAAFQSTPKDQWAGCVAALQNVVTECNTYLGLFFRSKVRKTAVKKLKVQAAAETKLFQGIIAANGQAYGAKMKALLKLIDDSVAFANSGIVMGAAFDQVERVIRTMLNSHDLLDQAALKQVMDDEIQRLRDIAAGPLTPQIVKDVILENLAHIGEVHLKEDKPGARTAKVGETDKKYVVNHALVQAGGSTERLGSLMHELTHVTTGETFDNAPLFLVFSKGKEVTPEGVLEIKTLAKTRNKGLLDILAVSAGDPGLSASQKSMIKIKCEYANKPMLSQYLGTFKEKLGGVDAPGYKSLKALADDGEINQFTGTLIEYDSVINQILMYLFDWGLKPPNPTWDLVAQLATAAKQFRDAAGA